MVIIGLSTNLDVKNGVDSMPRDYVLSVLRAGALPVILPMLPEDHPKYDEFMDKTINSVDGLLFTGGLDLEPVLYKEARIPQCHASLPERDKADMALFSRAITVKKPFLGICRGLQLCNVALGGSLYQDIPTQVKKAMNHEHPGTPHAHEVSIDEDSILHSIIQSRRLPVTSRHHQSIMQLSHLSSVSARADDGIIEAVELLDDTPGLCVQWHPENLAAADPRHQALFDWLVSMAKKRR